MNDRDKLPLQLFKINEHEIQKNLQLIFLVF